MHKDASCQKNCDFCGSVFYRDKRNTWSYWAKARFCSRTCSALYGNAKKREQTPTLASAFWDKVQKGGENECWKWNGTIGFDGYARLTFKKKQYRAPRVAVMISGRQIKETDHACHSCGNAWCCNPSHIYAGTPSQNNADKIEHGTHRFGSQVYCAVLHEENINDIRNSKLSNKKLGEIYGVSATCISKAKNKETWKHVK